MNNKTDKVTIFDVAREAQVSKSTVSLVLTQSTKVSAKRKERVLQAIDKLGYVYNRDAAALRGKRSNLVALVINDLTNPYSAQLAVSLEGYIYDMGMLPMVVNTAENWQRQQHIVKTLKEYNVAAFIMCPVPGTEQTWVDNLIASGSPVINIMREVPFSNAPTVLPDNKKGAHIATAHLLEQGITDIAFLGGTDDISDHLERLSGFKSALTQFNINEDKPVIQAPTNRQGGRDSFNSLYCVHPNIKAIVCFSDVIAYGVIEAIQQHGLSVGKDIKVVGFDDLTDSKLMSPSLSTVCINADEIGRRSCQILQELLSCNTAPLRTLVDVNLQIRDSSK